MSKRNNQDQKADLALTMATGSTVKAWAESRNVPDRTAYTWSRSPEILHQVEDIRRQAIDCAVGRLSDNAAAANKLARLVQEAAAESVQLQAARAYWPT